MLLPLSDSLELVYGLPSKAIEAHIYKNSRRGCLEIVKENRCTFLVYSNNILVFERIVKNKLSKFYMFAFLFHDIKILTLYNPPFARLVFRLFTLIRKETRKKLIQKLLY